MGEVAITVDHVSKRFRIYHERNNYLKAAVLRGRRARYDELWALRDVGFDIDQGETFGIIGENGSGKSTLLKCMAKILRPDEGRIAIAGRMSALLELGAGFHHELSGRENVYLNGSILGMGKKELNAKFDEIVEFAGPTVAKMIDTPVKNYSSGMYVRLGFAVAISVEPDVLLVDEVLAVGDANFQRKCLEQFASLRDRGHTIVIVSHGLGQLRTMCDRIAWLDNGVLQRVGTSDEVIDAYHEKTQPERQFSSTGETRWGTGEVRIDDVEIIGPNGTGTTRVHTGDRVRVRMSYQATMPIPAPVFGVAIRRSDGGILITSPTSRDAGVVPEWIGGPGHAEITFDALTLLEGSYDLSVSLTDSTGSHVYDNRQHVARFDVLRGTPHEEDGLVSLMPSWHVDEFLP